MLCNCFRWGLLSQDMSPCYAIVFSWGVLSEDMFPFHELNVTMGPEFCPGLPGIGLWCVYILQSRFFGR